MMAEAVRRPFWVGLVGDVGGGGGGRKWYTPTKIDIEPENDGLEDEFPSSRCVFSGSTLKSSGV